MSRNIYKSTYTHYRGKKHIHSVSSKMAKAIFAINKVKHFLPHIALRSLYLILVQSHIIYGIQLWGNGNTKKLEILQKRAVRIINNSGHKSHTDPILKSENILKIADIHQLQVSLFMYDYHSRTLPSSFDGFIPKKP